MPALGLAAEIRVGLVLDRGGRDDKSFNAAAFKGVSEAEKEFKIKVKTVEAADDNAFEPMMRSFAEKKFDLIIGVGFSQGDAIKKAAAQFPNTKFAIVDSEVNAPNVRALMFEEHQGSFLVGAAAAMFSKSGKVGFIGGMDIPLIRRFVVGYEAGVQHINPKATVARNFVGVTGEAWNNPPKAKELAMAQAGSGIDVIYAAAGASNVGVFDGAFERKIFAIGVDSNQNWVRPGTILTSMVKRVDIAVYEACKSVVQGKFTGGVIRFDLANEGIDFAIDQHNEKLFSPDQRAKLDALKQQIIKGTIKVPDYYVTGGSK